MAYSSKYAVELWDRNGLRLADLRGKAMGRSIVMSRNQPEDIAFAFDLNDFEKYCRDLKLDPKQILITNSTEVRVRRKGTYLCGGQLVYKSVRVTANDMSITCRAKGFLALFNKRYTGTTPSGFVSEVYTADESSALSRKDLAWALIEQSQALTNGDLGITRGIQGGSSTLHDKTYGRTNIMNALQNSTEGEDPIDIEFTHDKVFNTYESIGSDRPDVIFEFPGNIDELEASDDGTDVSNEIIGLGRGAPDGTQAQYFADDLVSQSNHALRQEVFTGNATDNSDGGLTDETEAVLEAKSLPIKIPALVVNGNIAPFVTDYKVGDRVTVKITGHPTVDDINGTYRIERIAIKIDDDDNEKVTLGVSAI